MTSKFRRGLAGPVVRRWRALGKPAGLFGRLLAVALLPVFLPGGCPSAENSLAPTTEKSDERPGGDSNSQPASNLPGPDAASPSGGGTDNGGPGQEDETSDDNAGGGGGGIDLLRPTVVEARAAVFEAESVTITLVGRSPTGQPLSFTIITPPETGTLGPVVGISATQAEVRFTAAASPGTGTQFTFGASDGVLESVPAAVVVTVLPRVYFEVSPTEGVRSTPVAVTARVVGGRSLPAGMYVWQIDGQVEAGPVTTHASRVVSFAVGGAHTVHLSLTPSGVDDQFDCRLGPTGTATEAIVSIWPRITGRVQTASGAPLAAAQIAAEGRPFGVTTDGTGAYAVDVPLSWSGAVSCSKAGYSFAPAEREIAPLIGDVTGVDFTGTPIATNRPPVANAQAVTTPEATARLITLSGSDADGDSLSYVIFSLPAHGTLRDGSGPTISAGQLPYVLAAGGQSVTYTPAAGYVGADGFSFRVRDGQAESVTAGVSITITSVGANVLYVDGSLGSASCTTYNVATRSCGGGGARAYRTLAGAAAAAQAGETVLIRGGTFGETLLPARSGQAGQPITFRAYGTETPTISGASLSPAIDLSNRSWIAVEGLRISNVRRWLLAVNAHNNVIRDCLFEHAVDSGGSARTGVFFEASTYNQVLDNVLDDSTQDNLALVQSDYNLVAGNTITSANHALFTIKCGNYNILRGNYFYNPRQKIGEAYDCDGVGVDHDIYAMNSTRCNVVEENVFNFTPSSGNASPFAGIQYAAQYGIIRRNVFFDTTGPALDMTLYGAEAEYNTHNRAYNNVFHGTDFAGIAIPGSGYNFTGNQFKNNVLYRSTFVRNDTRWDWYLELNGKPVQVLISRLDGFVFERNCIFHTTAGENYTITHGSRFNTNNGTQHNVAWWHTNHPLLFAGNVELDPRFVDPSARNYRLRSDSPMIDAAASLTRTVGGGSGTALRVEDSGYFCDGFGIAGEGGDEIQLAGQTASVRVLAIDRTTHTLTLSGPLTWTNGQGVALKFAGAGPDLGAFEFGQD